LDDQTVGKKDCVEKESLRNHEGEAQHGALPVLTKHVLEDFAPRSVIPNDKLEFFSSGCR
jgi:hypothetical protein